MDLRELLLESLKEEPNLDKETLEELVDPEIFNIDSLLCNDINLSKIGDE